MDVLKRFHNGCLVEQNHFVTLVLCPRSPNVLVLATFQITFCRLVRLVVSSLSFSLSSSSVIVIDDKHKRNLKRPKRLHFSSTPALGFALWRHERQSLRRWPWEVAPHLLQHGRPPWPCRCALSLRSRQRAGAGTDGGAKGRCHIIGVGISCFAHDLLRRGRCRSTLQQGLTCIEFLQ